MLCKELDVRALVNGDTVSLVLKDVQWVVIGLKEKPPLKQQVARRNHKRGDRLMLRCYVEVSLSFALKPGHPQ